MRLELKANKSEEQSSEKAGARKKRRTNGGRVEEGGSQVKQRELEPRPFCSSSPLLPSLPPSVLSLSLLPFRLTTALLVLVRFSSLTAG